MRVLLSDGSGLTSRQCAGLLGAAGHRVGVLAPGAAPARQGHPVRASGATGCPGTGRTRWPGWMPPLRYSIGVG